ncbi:T7SS effector LXG polymorphic toxin [Carnobacterium maltaromaticum]|uniref:T7SS effector LXG polymorphic toxin n=1 Tax=Carnobacterium maltaromaticum TaxID=2751 RepID=UPI0012F9F239|nr:DUF4258 domain-containing protein [Carnobacterium maltaromaticum]
MPKIDYQELKSMSDELTALRQTIVSHLEDYGQSNDAFTSDTILTGTAWDSGKGYHKNYKIISKSIFNALYDIDDAFKAHLAAFKGVVGEAENRLDTDELVELENELRRLQTQKLEFMEAMAEVFKDVPILKDFFAQNTMNGTIKEIELLKRYEHFENTTQGSFDGVYETIGAITEALAFMGESKNFAGGSKGYNEVNFTALGWHQQLDKYNQANEEDRYEIREIKTKYGTFYQVLKNGKVQKEASEALQYSELLDALGGMAKLTPEILKILVGLDDVEILLDDGSTTVQKMGSSMWLLLSVLPPDKIKDILKSAKLAKNSGKALDGIHITEKQWKEYKALDKSKDAIKVNKNIAKIGDDMGKMGILVKHPNINVDWSLYAEHGIERLNKRGMSQSLVESIVKNGKTLEQAGGNKYAFITQEGVAIVSKEGKLVTAWSKEFYDEPMIELLKKLFGE